MNGAKATVLPSRPMASFSKVLIAVALVGCGGATKAPASSEPPLPVEAPSTAQHSVPPTTSAAPQPESAPPSAGSQLPSASSSGGTAAEPPQRLGAPIEIEIVGKHAGDAAVERVITGARTGLQNCYETGLQGTPGAKGVVDFHVHVTASGVLKKVESANPNTMPGSVTNCMVGKFGALSFEPRPATIIEVKVTCRPND